LKNKIKRKTEKQRKKEIENSLEKIMAYEILNRKRS
jgi:hypothetical protein